MRWGSTERSGEGGREMDEERLAQVVSALQGLLDAEVLLPEEVEPLLGEAQAAVRSLQMGHEETARSLLGLLELEGEALVRSGLLDPPSGQTLALAICRAMDQDLDPHLDPHLDRDED